MSEFLSLLGAVLAARFACGSNLRRARSARTPPGMQYTNVIVMKFLQDLFGLADPANLKILKTNRFFFSFLRRFLQKSKNSQHSSVPDGCARGTRLALRRRRDIEKTVEKKPLKHL